MEEDPVTLYLYDKRTLYIPPKALKKMSASQKQYWDAKPQYIDLVLFFKVVSQRSCHVIFSFILFDVYAVIFAVHMMHHAWLDKVKWFWYICMLFVM